MLNFFLCVFKNELIEYKMKKNENIKINFCEIENFNVLNVFIVVFVDFNLFCKLGWNNKRVYVKKIIIENVLFKKWVVYVCLLWKILLNVNWWKVMFFFF